MKSAIAHTVDGRRSNDVFLALIKRAKPQATKRQQLAQQYLKSHLGYNDARARAALGNV